jgi:hypothetical protein
MLGVGFIPRLDAQMNAVASATVHVGRVEIQKSGVPIRAGVPVESSRRDEIRGGESPWDESHG